METIVSKLLKGSLSESATKLEAPVPQSKSLLHATLDRPVIAAGRRRTSTSTRKTEVKRSIEEGDEKTENALSPPLSGVSFTDDSSLGKSSPPSSGVGVFKSRMSAESEESKSVSMSPPDSAWEASLAEDSLISKVPKKIPVRGGFQLPSAAPRVLKPPSGSEDKKSKDKDGIVPVLSPGGGGLKKTGRTSLGEAESPKKDETKTLGSIRSAPKRADSASAAPILIKPEEKDESSCAKKDDSVSVAVKPPPRTGKTSLRKRSTSTDTVESKAAGTGDASRCALCDCSRFMPHPFKKGFCNQCFHEHS